MDVYRRKRVFNNRIRWFLWLGKVKPFSLLWMTGIDQYIKGNGSFQIKLFSAFTVGNDTKGKELDEAELGRWLAEVPLFPTDLLPSINFQWEQFKF